MNDLWNLNAGKIVAGIRNKTFSALEVTQATLNRMEAVNPVINAVVDSCAEEALAAALEMDNNLASNRPPGPLAGVPVTVKVNIDQAGYANTNGLRIQQDLVASEDSPVVSNLKRAGAIIVGRTNTPAFSLRWFTRNSLHGHTVNPHTATITPGGSSGGAAAAVASGIGCIGHGTDIGGSIRYPAYACGIFGLRPTFGRVPAWNPGSPDRHIGPQLMAVSGPLARTTSDLEAGFSALCKEDVRDPWWVPVDQHLPNLPRKVALCTHPDGMNVVPEVAAALNSAARHLESAGWTVEEVNPPSLIRASEIQLKLWMSEYVVSGMEVFERENDPDALFVIKQLQSRAGNPGLADVLSAIQARLETLRHWQRFLHEYPVLLCPISAELPFPDLDDLRSESRFAEILAAQHTQLAIPALGLPAMSVPTGKVGQTPVGVQLVAARFREDILFAASRDIEEQSPKLTPVTPTA